MSESVLKYLAETQSSEEIPEQDAEPGKILHEMRRGEMAATGEVPFARYYGSVDSTPLFVVLAGAYLLRTANLHLIRELWPNVKRALAWIDTYGDCDGDGFVEYQQKSEKGLVQQGWKDSHDSIFHADGGMADPPIALCEVQGYVYAAKQAAATIAQALGETAFANRLEVEAATIRSKFDQAFWCEQLGTYAIALDGEKKQCKVRASNAGHALFCKIATPERAAAVAESLMNVRCFSGWGVRTIGASEARYNPMSYHNGSVWPHDNAMIGMGFSSYGLQENVCRILYGLHAASRYVDLHRLPELFCGFHKRSDASGPTLYPVACAPQAWAAGSVYLLLQACLGLNIRATERQIQFVHPSLPENLDEVRIENLTVLDASTDLLIRRKGVVVTIEVVRTTGKIEVISSA
jgi:glycogen debranching enzyme